MAKRTSVRRFDTKEVQGEGSYVVLSSLTVDEVRDLRKAGKDENFDAFEGGIDLLTKHIESWDWVNNSGKPLPLPKNDPTVVGQLTHAEADFLSDLLIEAGSKNSEGRSEKPSSPK